MKEILLNVELDKTISVLTLIIAIILAYLAIIEYRRAQKWKKNEFLANEIKEFFSDRDVKRALLVLDWECIDIPLFENELPEFSSRFFLYTDQLLDNALSPNRDAEFTDQETIIRKSFDEFFTRLSMFQNFIDNGLFTSKDLEPYLIYWIRLLGDTSRSRKRVIHIHNIWKFILGFEYFQVEKLLNHYGYKIQ